METDSLDTLIQAKNYAEIGNVFSRALPGGAAIEFLEKVIESLNGGLSHKKSKSSTTEVTNVAPKDVKTSYILNDAVDEVSITLAIQIPEDMNLIAYIIGAKGINVMNIGKSSGTKIQVEKVSTRGADQYRHIFIMGTLKNVLRAYQVSSSRVTTNYLQPQRHFIIPATLPPYNCRHCKTISSEKILHSPK
jgi:KH domain